MFSYCFLDLNGYEEIFRSLPWRISKYFWVAFWSIATLVVFSLCLLECQRRRKSWGLRYWDTRATQYSLLLAGSIFTTLEAALNPLSLERNTTDLAWTDFLWSFKYIISIWTTALVWRSWLVRPLQSVSPFF